ncbi:MAG: T9SS type A sorting domain-containing protein, partial [Flavicella sp.]
EKEHPAMAKIDMYSLEFSTNEAQEDDEPDYLYLFGFRTVKKPPLPNYETYQNISSGKKTLKLAECKYIFEEDCLSFVDNKLEYESNDTKIFKKKLLSIAKMLSYSESDPNFQNFKNMLLKVRVVLERRFFRNGSLLIKSIRLPGVEEIIDLTSFLHTDKLKVFPNPSSNGEFNMLLNTHIEYNLKFIVKNSFGKTVINKTISHPFENQHIQINPNEPLPPGIYYLMVYTGTYIYRRTLLVL